MSGSIMMWLEYSGPHSADKSYCPVEVVFNDDIEPQVHIQLQDGMYDLYAGDCDATAHEAHTQAMIYIERIQSALARGRYCDFDNGVEGLSMRLVGNPEYD